MASMEKIKVTIRGIDVFVSSTAEAAALVREFTEPEAPKLGRPPKERPQLIIPPRRSDVVRMAEDFLFKIASGNPKGISTEDITPVLKVKAGRGIGGRCAKINRILAKYGFADSDEVYTSQRLAEGRVWRKGPKIQEAIEKLHNG